MNNSVNKLIWVMFGVAFGIAVTGLVFFCFAPSASHFFTARNSKNNIVEHTVSRPVSDSKPGTDQIHNNEDEGVAISGTGPATSPRPADTAKPEVAPGSQDVSQSPAPAASGTEAPADNSNADFTRLLAEANQLLDVIVKLDFTTSPLPDYQPLVKQLAGAAHTADELKTAMELEKKFQAAVKQVEEKRETWFLARLGESRSSLDELKGSPVVSPASLTDRVSTLLAECTELRSHAPTTHTSQCDALTDEVGLLLKTLKANQRIYTDLNSLDKVENDQNFEETLRQIASRYADSPFAKDIAVVLDSLPILAGISLWNEFVEANGTAFDQFAVPAANIAAGAAFFHGHGRDLSFLPEWKILQKRLKQLQASAKELPVNEKITTLLRHAGSRSFWIYKKTPSQWFYLIQKPVTGNNIYLADLYGTEGTVVIPNDTVSTIDEAASVLFFKKLGDQTESVEDSLKFKDPGRWYAQWCEIIEAIRTRPDLDPLVQFLFLKDICTTLAEADSHFAKRLAPWLRVLNSTDFATGVDWYDAEGKDTARLRTTAAQLLRFLQGDELSFSKTTQELNEIIEPLSFVYSRLGWLDRTPGGSWYCRLFSSLTAPKDGELYVLQYSPENEKCRWIRIGRLEAGKVAVELISNDLRLGLPVYVRTRVNSR